MSTIFRTIFVALAIGLFTHSIYAETGNANKDYLSGLSKEELTEYLGKPDQISSPSAGSSSGRTRAEWRYGNSLVFLVDGKVTAWSDSGDLESRKLVSSLQPNNGRGRLKDGGLEGWKNAWEKEDEITSDEVVSDLIEKTLK